MTAHPSSSASASVPPLDKKSRTLVLCFDGTSNEYDATVGAFPLPPPHLEI